MGCLYFFGALIVIAMIIGILPYALVLLAVCLLIYIGFSIKPIEKIQRHRLKKIEEKYYRSEEFIRLKQESKKYVEDCNSLNEHIGQLKDIHVGFDCLDYGKANYYDSSRYHYVRPEFSKHIYEENVYNCSNSVCENSRRQPFKYVCKYFNIKFTEENLEVFENLLNNLETAREGIRVLEKEKSSLLCKVGNEVPPIIKKYGFESFQYKLGFKFVKIDEIVYPKYIFQYVSAGGNASTRNEVILDVKNLNKFIIYLSEKIAFRKSVAGQRALMTSELRKKILIKYDYTCKYCGNSLKKEPNLLLEVDHIIPVSKGGLTTEDNLQVLCWKCNRKKGNKIESNTDSREANVKDFPEEKKESVEICNHKEIEQKYKSNLSNNKTEEKTAEIDNIIKDSNLKEERVESRKMYDKEKGIYPSGHYLVGRDLPLGGYILTAKQGKRGSVELFSSYAQYKKQDCDPIEYDSFDEDMHIALMEENTFLVVQDANIQKI